MAEQEVMSAARVEMLLPVNVLIDYPNMPPHTMAMGWRAVVKRLLRSPHCNHDCLNPCLSRVDVYKQGSVCHPDDCVASSLTQAENELTAKGSRSFQTRRRTDAVAARASTVTRAALLGAPPHLHTAPFCNPVE